MKKTAFLISNGEIERAVCILVKQFSPYDETVHQ